MDPMLRAALRKYRGLRDQLDNMLLGDDGDAVEAELRKFVAKRPCWVRTEEESPESTISIAQPQASTTVEDIPPVEAETRMGLRASAVDPSEAITRMDWRDASEAVTRMDWRESTADAEGESPDRTVAMPDLHQLEVAAEPIDPLITVDRSVPPKYPVLPKIPGGLKAKHPELENQGPSTYDVRGLEPWLHPQQMVRSVKARLIYEYLRDNNLLLRCLDARDLEEIRQKGILFFSVHFPSGIVYAWRSVVEDANGDLHVPVLLRGSDAKLHVTADNLRTHTLHSGQPAHVFAVPQAA